MPMRHIEPYRYGLPGLYLICPLVQVAKLFIDPMIAPKSSRKICISFQARRL
jgi:hypothetical protein